MIDDKILLKIIEFWIENPSNIGRIPQALTQEITQRDIQLILMMSISGEEDSISKLNKSRNEIINRIHQKEIIELQQKQHRETLDLQQVQHKNILKEQNEFNAKSLLKQSDLVNWTRYLVFATIFLVLVTLWSQIEVLRIQKIQMKPIISHTIAYSCIDKLMLDGSQSQCIQLMNIGGTPTSINVISHGILSNSTITGTILTPNGAPFNHCFNVNKIDGRSQKIFSKIVWEYYDDVSKQDAQNWKYCEYYFDENNSIYQNNKSL